MLSLEINAIAVINNFFHRQQILSDKLEEVQKSKLLYKERWAAIVREIQIIKNENDNSSRNSNNLTKFPR